MQVFLRLPKKVRNDEFISAERGGFGKFTMPDNATKLKISFRSEPDPIGIYYLTTRDLHFTCEFASGILFQNCFNAEINGTNVSQVQGDVISVYDGFDNYTFDDGTNNVYYKNESTAHVTDLRILNCTLEDARRQGISFVSNGENYLIKNNEHFKRSL